ncbi:MAG: hypothetical protein AB1817_05660 [Chloroflexota bacterium]
MGRTVTLDDAVALAMQLPPLDKIRLIERLAPRIEQDLLTTTSARRSLLGLWADLGVAPSASEIDAARREMWKSFPREDIA